MFTLDELKSGEKIDGLITAMRAYFSDTHNLAEGAGAASLAALGKERAGMSGKKDGVILSGGNVDAAPFDAVLNGGTLQLPRVA